MPGRRNEPQIISNESETTVVVAPYLPQLPNWLPLSSQSDSQVDRNLNALLATSQELFGASFEAWLARLDNAYSDTVRRCREASMMPAGIKVVAGQRAARAARRRFGP